jgi:hypothetical protein
MAATLTVNFVGDTSHLSKSFKTAEGDARSFGGKVKGHVGIGMGSIVKGAGLASLALVGAQGLKSAFSAILGDYTDHDKAAKQTEAVLKSTGHAAGVSKDQIIAHADAIEKLSGQDDVAVQAGENMLLTFTNIKNRVGEGNKTFNDATQAMADLSAATGKSMPAAATMLGKALNDPIKGISALSRVGVQFDSDQKKLIKTYVKHGETAKAQNIILREMQKEFGGSAKAAGETLSGKIDILKARFFDMTGDLMDKIMPALTELAGWLGDNLPVAAQKVSDAFEAATTFMRDVWAKWGDDIKAVAKAVMDAIGPYFDAAKKTLGDALKLLGDVLKGKWGDAWDDIKKLPKDILLEIKAILEGGGTLLAKAAKAIGEAVLDKIKEGLGNLGGWAADKIGDIRDALLAAPGRLANAAKDLGSAVLGKIKDGFGDIGGWIVTQMKNALNWVITKFNSAVHLKFSFDTHIPGVGKVGIDIDPPDVPYIGGGSSGGGGGKGSSTTSTSSTVAQVPSLGGNAPASSGPTIVFHQTPADADPNAIAAAVAWRLRTVST